MYGQVTSAESDALGGGGETYADAMCPSPYFVTGGGYHLDGVVSTAAPVTVYIDRPIDNQTWRVGIHDGGTTTIGVTVWALCIALAP